jgi:uncharacterized protein YggE
MSSNPAIDERTGGWVKSVDDPGLGGTDWLKSLFEPRLPFITRGHAITGMRRQSIAAIALALLAVTAGCSALTGASNPNPAAQSPDESNPNLQASGSSGGTVEVAATGQVQTAPDRAVVRVAVVARDDSVETIRRRLAENSSQLRTALEEAGIDADQITTSRFEIERNYRADERPAEPEYQGRHSFVVTLEEVERAGEIVVTAAENGANRIRGVRFTITPDTRRELRKEALAEAVQKARGKAMVAANNTGLELAGVGTVRTSDVSTRPVRRRESYLTAGGDGGGGGAPTAFEGGKVTVSANVLVVYNASGG